MTELKPGETLNLRCQYCGQMRTPILDRAADGIITVACFECMRRWQAERSVFSVEEKPISWVLRSLS